MEEKTKKKLTIKGLLKALLVSHLVVQCPDADRFFL